MSVEESAPRSDAMPFDSGHLNHEFLKKRLPAWLYNAPRASRDALRKSLLYSQFSRRAVEPLRTRLVPVEQFAKPLLEQALYKRFGVQLDVNANQLVTMRYEEAVSIRRLTPYKQTLLQAALQNFQEAEASPGYFKPGSALLPVDGLQLQLVEGTGTGGRAPHFRYEYRGILGIKPEQFAELCHGLDLGGKYQAHLDGVFKPACAAGQAEAVATAFMNSERDALEVLAHIAMMKKHISTAAYQMLLQLVKTNGKPLWDAQPVRYGQLHMLGDRTFEGSILYGALLIELDIPGVENGPCVVYMPAEPEHPLKEYPSLMALLVVLRRKLVDKTYQQYFRRFVSLRHSHRFFTRLNERLTPLTRREDSSLLKPLYEHRFDPAADLELQAYDIGKPPFEMLYEHLRSKTCDDARVIAVPSRDEDQKAREQRLQGFEALGLNLLNAMGFFVPVLGEIMSVVAAGQLLHEFFVAVEEWDHGDLNEAFDHLFDIAENLAGAAVLGAAVGVRPAPEPSVFVESLRQLSLSNGRIRLWKPALNPFGHGVELPAWLPADAHGRIKMQGQLWLPLGDRFYRIELDTNVQQWRIKHPRGTQPYSPVIEHHGAGAWRCEVENPLGWDEATAFKRLGSAEQSLTHEGMQKVLNITGADEALMRQVHVQNLKSPALLHDCAQRLAIDEQIDRIILALEGGHHYQVGTAHIDPWLNLLIRSPRWPTGRQLRLLDEQGGELVRLGSKAGMVLPAIDLIWQPGSLDALLGTVLDGLQAHEMDTLIGAGTAQKNARIQRLADYLTQRAELERAQLFDDIYAAQNSSSNPHVNLLRRDFPALPVAVAEELISSANTVQLQRMEQAARLPLEIAEHAREYLQQLRVNRANEGFYLNTTNNPDTFTVGLRLLEQLPAWPDSVAIEVRQDSVAGELLDSIGDPQTAEVRQTIIKTQDGYQCQGDEGQPDALFFTALSQALPASVRGQVGLSSTAREQDLRLLLGELAVNQRGAVAKILKLQAIKPGFKWPLRLADGRVGYPLSGRLRGMFNRLGLRAPRYNPELAVKSLFPSFTDEEVSAFLFELRREYVGAAAYLNRFLRLRLESLADEYQAMDTELSLWIAEAPTPSLMRSARQVAADRLRRCWTRTGTTMHGDGGEVLGYSLDLSDLSMGRLPTITARFDHVAFLTLKNTYVTAAQAEAFLNLFSRLTYLSLQRNHLLTVPPAIGRMHRLKRLWLSNNPLTLDVEGIGHLQRLRRLRFLDLSYCQVGPELNLVGLNPLRSLLLRSTGINRVPDWIWGWHELTDLDLRDNQITAISPGVLQRFDRYGMHVQLHDNPFNELTLRQARTYLSDYSRTRLGLSETRPNAPVLLPPGMPWFISVDNEILPPRLQQWRDLAAEPESADFFQTLSSLSTSADFAHHRRMLTERVWNVLDAASVNTQLRQELFALAAHPRTCGDGVSIVFGELEIHALVFDIKSSTPQTRQPGQMFRLARSLERLDQVEKIAQEDIVARLMKSEAVDQAEVRLGYRVGLAKLLDLPAQPRSMLFSNLSGVGREKLAAAQQRILARERTPAFWQSLIEREFWMEYLEEHFAARFEPVKAPFVERLLALDSSNEQQYLDQVSTISQERREAVKGLAISLSEAVADEVLEEGA